MFPASRRAASFDRWLPGATPGAETPVLSAPFAAASFAPGATAVAPDNDETGQMTGIRGNAGATVGARQRELPPVTQCIHKTRMLQRFPKESGAQNVTGRYWLELRVAGLQNRGLGVRVPPLLPASG